MKINKLIPCGKFNILQADLLKQGEITINDYLHTTYNMALLQDEAPTIEMFVPIDKDGNVLKEPNDYIEGFGAYSEAKQLCLFEGFEVFSATELGHVEISNGSLDLSFKNGKLSGYSYSILTLSHLTKYELLLTDKAINDIYGTETL